MWSFLTTLPSDDTSLTESSARTVTHVVTAGETYEVIAGLYGVALDKVDPTDRQLVPGEEVTVTLP